MFFLNCFHSKFVGAWVTKKIETWRSDGWGGGILGCRDGGGGKADDSLAWVGEGKMADMGEYEINWRSMWRTAARRNFNMKAAFEPPTPTPAELLCHRLPGWWWGSLFPLPSHLWFPFACIIVVHWAISWNSTFAPPQVVLIKNKKKVLLNFRNWRIEKKCLVAKWNSSLLASGDRKHSSSQKVRLS